VPAFVGLLINHRPRCLRGRSLIEVLDIEQRQPARLQALFLRWRRHPQLLYRAPPSLVFAVLGQARFDGRLSPEDESRLIGKLLAHWALRSTLDVSAACARRSPRQSLPQPAISIR